MAWANNLSVSSQINKTAMLTCMNFFKQRFFALASSLPTHLHQKYLDMTIFLSQDTNRILQTGVKNVIKNSKKKFHTDLSLLSLIPFTLCICLFSILRNSQLKSDVCRKRDP